MLGSGNVDGAGLETLQVPVEDTQWTVWRFHLDLTSRVGTPASLFGFVLSRGMNAPGLGAPPSGWTKGLPGPGEELWLPAGADTSAARSLFQLRNIEQTSTVGPVLTALAPEVAETTPDIASVQPHWHQGTPTVPGSSVTFMRSGIVSAIQGLEPVGRICLNLGPTTLQSAPVPSRAVWQTDDPSIPSITWATVGGANPTSVLQLGMEVELTPSQSQHPFGDQTFFATGTS
ncbi:MAG: hypothetical protein ACFCGT_09635 [Sandaracinaceae bacterium]